MSQAINAGIATANQLNQSRENKGDSLGKSDFLLLLVTQFKYQDPLNPMDDKEFVAQLSQFSSLEQLMNLNTSMDSLTAATKEQRMMQAANYIGMDVAAGGNSIAKTDEGISKLYWAIGSDMAKGSLYVYDQNFNQIYGEQLGPRAAGTYTFDWDGKNYAGQEVPNGVYYITLACTDANGEGMLTDRASTGRVIGVTVESGEAYLRMEDGRMVALKDVREIASPPPSANNNANNTNNGSNNNTGNGSGGSSDGGSGSGTDNGSGGSSDNGSGDGTGGDSGGTG
jgi:flagellar basal-body rod modification protein FlgD